MFSPILLLVVVFLCMDNNKYNINNYNSCIDSLDNKTEDHTNKKKDCCSLNSRKRKDHDIGTFKNIDLEERREMIQEIMPYLNISDKNTISKLQDMIDIIYKMNRVRENSYDENDYRQLNNVSFLENAQGIIRNIAPHLNKTERINSENIINFLKGIEMAQYNLQRLNRRGNNNPQTIIESLKPMIESEPVNFKKIKDMLRRLNEEN